MDYVDMIERFNERMGQQQDEQEKLERENPLQAALDRYDENDAKYRRWLIHPY